VESLTQNWQDQPARETIVFRS